MNIVAFEQLSQEINDKRQEILESKRPEYTEGNVDVLTNFKAVAAELKIDPLVVAYVYLRKHIASIGQVCGRARNVQGSEPFEERICDAINYLELIYALYNDNP